MSTIDLDSATRAYMSAALWSTLGDDGEPLDRAHTPEDFAADSAADMARVVASFVTVAETERPGIFAGLDSAQVGHDLWLTRNGHGTGFWDLGLGERGEWLTALAKPYGEADVYIGDDGALHCTDA